MLSFLLFQLLSNLLCLPKKKKSTLFSFPSHISFFVFCINGRHKHRSRRGNNKWPGILCFLAFHHSQVCIARVCLVVIVFPFFLFSSFFFFLFFIFFPFFSLLFVFLPLFFFFFGFCGYAYRSQTRMSVVLRKEKEILSINIINETNLILI